MKKRQIIPLIIIFLFTSISFNSCKKDTKTHSYTIEQGFVDYIDSYTSGIISVKSDIIIKLNQDSLKKSIDFKSIDKNIFKIKPNTKGILSWHGPGNIRFVPTEKLLAGTKYTVELNLSKLMNTPVDLSNLKFNFDTKIQDIAISLNGLEAYDIRDIAKQKYTGQIISADYIDDIKIEKILSAKQNGEKKNIIWEHNKNKTKHKFSISDIIRKDKNTKLSLNWEVSSLRIKDIDSQQIEIPAIGIFIISKTRIVQQPEQYISIHFSDPLDIKQNLNGLIRLKKHNKFKFIIDKNEIKAYPSSRLSGNYKLIISQGIKNSLQKALNEDIEIDVRFENIKPAVRLIGKGVISPNSEGLIFPFEAVGLKYVDIRIIEIFEKNILSFYQNNNIDNQRDIKKVARLILDKKINLGKNRFVDFNNWNSFSLDISKLIKVNKGSIYNIEIRFNKKYSVYKNEQNTISTQGELKKELEYKKELKQWDKPSYYSSYYYPSNYRWQDRNNPSSDSYYNSDRFASRNIFASNMGIIAKMSDDNNIFFAVSNLLNSKPMQGVRMEVYNYQNQLLKAGKTDKNGFLKMQVKSKPFLLKAKKNKERGYLKLDASSSLSLSNFDVSGQMIKEGIKGYIYAERGVWRPGDKIHLTFILEDKKNVLPENHPIVFSLINPQGQSIKRIVKNTSINGFYNFTCKTDSEAITGNWKAKVEIGDALFEKKIKIETVKPNRLKIELTFDDQTLYSKIETQNIGLNVKWLHGATAKNMKANIKLRLSKTETKFASFRNYIFDDKTKEFKTEDKVVFNSKINDKGKAIIKLKLKANTTAPGMLKANFISRVFEEGGDFSINMQSKNFAPYSSFVGLKLPSADRGWYTCNTNHILKIASVNAKGVAINRKNVRIKIYKIDWSWWWESDQTNLANYINRRSARLVFDKQVNTLEGKAKVAINIKYNSWRDWGRYLIKIIDPISKHSSSTTAYFSQGYGRVPEGAMDNATQLSFISDKDKYTVGQKANISIPSAKNGKALISIETGSKVLNTFWIDTKLGKTDFTFDITAEMAPNAYVSVIMIQNHDQTQNDKPIRMYGVIPIMVEDPNTRLEPVIVMKKILEPEKNFEIKVTEKNGKHMTYTIAVVDDGLLDLTNFNTPAPWNVFYAREALGVKTWDMYDMVLGAFGARLEKAFAIGGDESYKGRDAKKASRFKPVVMFYGPYDLKSNESKTHKFKMPNYVGSVRTMLIAGYKGAYGTCEETSTVRKALMILPNVPRVLGPGEKFSLPINVFAMDKKVKNVKIKISSNDLVKTLGTNNKHIIFTQTGEKIVQFNLEVANKIGIAKIKISAEANGETANYEVEIDVRNPNPKLINIQDSILKEGESWIAQVKKIGMQASNTCKLELSNIPAINLTKRLDYLISYPHGCIEQTTSSVFPQLFLNKLTELSHDEKMKTSSNIMSALNRLLKFQTSDGGFSYWPGGNQANEWGTSYAGHFFLKAEELGYALPIGMKNKWIKYQTNKARNWKSKTDKQRYRSDDLIQAYRLYSLALAEKEQLGAMNRFREKLIISKQAKWRLATTYAIIGQKETAKEIIAELSTSVDTYRELSGSFGSSTRDLSMILESLCIIGNKTRAFALLEKISKTLASDEWLSTQTTAYSLLAISEFIGGDTGSDNLKFTYIINGKETKVNSILPISQIEIELDVEDIKNVKIVNTSDKILYTRLISSGIPLIGDKTNSSRNLQMNISYTNIDGKTLNIDKIKQTSDIIATVSIRNTGTMGDYKELALTQIFPSGWEIVNTRFGDISQDIVQDKFNFIDIRDDRVFTYFDLKQGETKHFTVLLNASYLGRFYLPSVSCQAMYDNNIHTHKAGQWVQVIK